MSAERLTAIKYMPNCSVFQLPPQATCMPASMQNCSANVDQFNSDGNNGRKKLRS